MTQRSRSICIGLLVLSVTSARVNVCIAQRLPNQPRTVSAFAYSLSSTSTKPMATVGDSARIRPTHWLTGALIGGTALGALGLIGGYQLCDMGDTPCNNRPQAMLALGFIFGMVGFGVGALIGGQFPK